MREIEFRGKALDDNSYFCVKKGDWIYGNYSYDKLYKQINIEDTTNEDIKSIEVDPETVGEYTGRDDRNGKKIFEGDIVKYGCICSDGENNEYIEESIGLVYFNCEDCFFCIHYNSHDGFICDDYFNDIEYVEVIGNVHDNSELLEVADVKD